MKSSRCLFCNRIVKEKTSLQVRGYAICPRCEEKILKAKVGTPEYMQHLQRIKKLWSD